MPLQGKKLLKSIQKRCRIQPGDLVMSPMAAQSGTPKMALVVGLSPSCRFERDYEGAEDHIFYKCEPFDGTPAFVDYACNMEQVS